MANLKIARQAYRRARKSSLAAFAENVYSRTKDAADYPGLQAELDVLASLTLAYRQALAAAHNRGSSEILAKNLAQAALIGQLDVLATAVEALGQSDAQLIVKAGFTLQKSTAQRYGNRIPPPIIRRASSTGNKGEVRIELDDLVPNAVLTHALEYSLDGETNWQNGIYHSFRKFTVRGLPHSPELWLRSRSIGHADNKSEWSDPFPAAVL